MELAETRVLAADDRVERQREESRESLERLLGLLGYPKDWAAELETRAYAQGRAWRDVA